MTIFEVHTANGEFGCVLPDGSWRRICIGDGPVQSFLPGWTPCFVYDGFAPIYILELQHEDGNQSSWYLDQNWRRVAGTLAELEPILRLQLADKATIILDQLELLFFTSQSIAPEPVTCSFLRLNRQTRREIAAAYASWDRDEPAMTELEQHNLEPLEGQAESSNATEWFRDLLNVDLRERYADACETLNFVWRDASGAIEIPDVRAFCLTPLLVALRCVDPSGGPNCFIVVAGHDQQPSAAYIPSVKHVFIRDRAGRASLRIAGIGIRRALIEHLLEHGTTLVEWLRRPLQGIATYMFSARSAHIGHYLWNELPGLLYVVKRIAPKHFPSVFALGSAQGVDFFGPLEQLFPELASSFVRSHDSIDEMLNFGYERGIQIIRFSGAAVSVDLRQRILSSSARDPAVVALRQAPVAITAGRPMILLGLRTENRTHVDLSSFYVALIQRLTEIYPGLTIIVDGHNRKPNGEIFPSFLEHYAVRPPMQAEQDIAGALEKAVEGKSVTLINCVGSTVPVNLFWIERADFFVAPWGAGLAKYRWVCNKPGYVFTNTINLRAKDDLAIYQDPTIMETPSHIQFVKAEYVIDLIDAPQLISMDVMGNAKQFYTNFNLKTDEVLSDIVSTLLRHMPQSQLAPDGPCC